MSQMLYVRCMLCDGTLTTRQAIRRGSETIPAGSPCPICQGVLADENEVSRPDGYSPIGMTVGQIDMIRENGEAMALALAYLLDQIDPSKCSTVMFDLLMWLRRRFERPAVKSGVYSALLKVNPDAIRTGVIGAADVLKFWKYLRAKREASGNDPDREPNNPPVAGG